MATSSQTHFPRKRKRSYRTEREIEKANERAFREEAWQQRACAVSGDARDVDENGRKNWEAHHVVERRWLKANYIEQWNARNSLRLTPRVHEQHTTRHKPIPLTCLTQQNIDYAFEVMGYMAHDYLHRLYSGEDPRVEAAFEKQKAGEK